jgi:DNA-binding IclR family transcriptional regulator
MTEKHAPDGTQAVIRAVGAVRCNSLGTPLGAISLGGPTNRFTSTLVDSLGRELVTVAERLAPLIQAME